MSDHKKTVGTKAEVFHGTAKHTSGGLHKKDLMKHKGRIVSRKKHAAGKKAIQRLFKLGYKPTKGSFKAMKKGHSTRKHRGGGPNDASGNSVPVAGFSVKPM
jgi:hypothetical protein